MKRKARTAEVAWSLALGLVALTMGCAVCADPNPNWYDLEMRAAKGDTAARQQLQKGAEDGDSLAQMSYASLQFSDMHPDQGFAWELKSAQQGNVGAEFGVGSFYMNGTGVPKDFDEAIRWTKKSFDDGNQYADVQLGTLYRYTHRPDLAISAFQHAAGRGVTDGDFETGLIYDDGEDGIGRDLYRARVYFERAAAHGDVNALEMLGNYYLAGIGLAPDMVRGLGYYKDAIKILPNAGIPWGICRLGTDYFFGLGSSATATVAHGPAMDHVDALALAFIGVDHETNAGSRAVSQKSLDSVLSRATPDEIRLAKARAISLWAQATEISVQVEPESPPP